MEFLIIKIINENNINNISIKNEILKIKTIIFYLNETNKII